MPSPLTLAMALAATLLAGCQGLAPSQEHRRSEPSSSLPAARSSTGAAAPGAGVDAPSPAPSALEVSRSGAELRAPTAEELKRYAWLDPEARIRSLEASFPEPPGLQRVPLAPSSFGAFLRGLPLRGPDAEVRAHDGRLLRPAGHPGVAAVVELDVSKSDLQQCADTVLRLHAEWRWSRGEAERAAYQFTSGDLASFAGWARGERPIVEGAKVRWAQKASPANDRASYRRWLELVFTYAGTVSIAREGERIERGSLAPGDYFVLPGGPGHAVLVLDLTTDASGAAYALLGQGFMPAQDMHVLRDASGTAWFSLDGEAVDTPFWPEPFPWSSLRRLPVR
jgi:hypothetical protein